MPNNVKEVLIFVKNVTMTNVLNVKKDLILT
jgi:hypothetical protein